MLLAALGQLLELIASPPASGAGSGGGSGAATAAGTAAGGGGGGLPGSMKRLRYMVQAVNELRTVDAAGEVPQPVRAGCRMLYQEHLLVTNQTAWATVRPLLAVRHAL